MDNLKVPVRLVDGVIGEIIASVPWTQLLQDSCVIEVKRLEVTLEPRRTLNADELQSDLGINSCFGCLFI
jgi:hypothetical protein